VGWWPRQAFCFSKDYQLLLSPARQHAFDRVRVYVGLMKTVWTDAGEVALRLVEVPQAARAVL
jgi:hypothetical protein